MLIFNHDYASYSLSFHFFLSSDPLSYDYLKGPNSQFGFGPELLYRPGIRDLVPAFHKEAFSFSLSLIHILNFQTKPGWWSQQTHPVSTPTSRPSDSLPLFLTLFLLLIHLIWQTERVWYDLSGPALHLLPPHVNPPTPGELALILIALEY